MPSIQLGGVPPDDAVDEFGNPLNPTDQYGLPLYPPPTADELRSPNPINWPTRAPGQAPIFSNAAGRFFNALRPPRSDSIIPQAETGELPSRFWPPTNTTPGTTITPPHTPTPPGLTINTPTPAQQGPPIPPHFMNTTNIGPQTYGGGPSPLPAPGAQARPPSTGAMPPRPLPAPGAQARPPSTGAMPPRSVAGGGEGGAINPATVNVGYGAPGVGHYVPTTGVGRGPGTWVPGGAFTTIDSPNASGRQMGALNLGGLFGGGGGATIPPNATAQAPAPRGPLALPTSYTLPSGARLTPQGNVIPAPQPLDLATSYKLPSGARLTPQGAVIPNYA